MNDTNYYHNVIEIPRLSNNEIHVCVMGGGPPGPPGEKGEAGRGLPPGGIWGQILKKKTSSDYETEWIDDDLPLSNVEIQRILKK